MIYDVAVIGAGVVGALCARELTKYDVSVVVLEKEEDVAMGASKANSAIVHGGFDPEPGTLKAKFNARGAQMMAKLCEDLDVHYKNNGSLVLAFNDEQNAHIKKLYERGKANGISGLSVISGDEARALEGALSELVTSALLCTSSGIVCPYDLTIAAMGNAMDNGARLMLGYAVSSIRDNGEYYEISDRNETVNARYIINSAGLYADKIAEMIGDEYHIVSKRGEYMLFDKSEGNLVLRTIFQTPTKAGKGILVTPTVDGNLLIGPTSEICEKEDKSTTLEGLDKVREIAAKSTDKLNFRKVITSFAGLRASCAESDDFIIEMSKNSSRALELVGIDSPGLSSAPAIAEYAVKLLSEAGLEAAPKDDFIQTRVSCRRFESMSAEEKNKVIENDCSYGHIICRCEGITEGEIAAAIRQNPPARSLDAVKRRTRATMGRCQGGFCTPFITEILARELDCDETRITKFGGGSNILIGKTK